MGSVHEVHRIILGRRFCASFAGDPTCGYTAAARSSFIKKSFSCVSAEEGEDERCKQSLGGQGADIKNWNMGAAPEEVGGVRCKWACIDAERQTGLTRIVLDAALSLSTARSIVLTKSNQKYNGHN